MYEKSNYSAIGFVNVVISKTYGGNSMSITVTLFKCS